MDYILKNYEHYIVTGALYVFFIQTFQMHVAYLAT